ncbi:MULTISPECIES: hypothetical protein [unclassified Flavobacterium]|jgi:hypothetical protein|uniref:hypothetical protein n=1 Tax=unclassified Flavobacterium TaxID=196869 RepID=UPI0025C209A0|nr:MULTISPECIES: hypothetical protein [unclassified Flavobacterium]
MKIFLKKYWPLIFFVLVVLYSFGNLFFKSREESVISYNFVISKINVSPTKSLILYKNENEVDIWNYDIRENEGVEAGDSIAKKKCAKYLYVYKKDKHTNKYKLFLKVEPTGIFPCEWFCN